MAQMPEEDIKIIIGPKGAFGNWKAGPTVVAVGILLAAGLAPVDSDIICPSLQQNIVVACVPKRENDDRFVRMKKIIAMESRTTSLLLLTPRS
ncbi:hypothetical protein HPB50_004367 [Hyalomma asiaticum]|uniref:Uncharacterized protein n=1 Tax=Hyalomma asiaticum TaxID=266040 RepID=A0ACB7RI70_HYAAI|nr:hypothetical protein HPB50_004367 [Hyalomma asiaticum]